MVTDLKGMLLLCQKLYKLDLSAMDLGTFTAVSM